MRSATAGSLANSSMPLSRRFALYSDALRANLLAAASSYPLEVVQADRWLDEH
jgi:hypothetical protein